MIILNNFLNNNLHTRILEQVEVEVLMASPSLQLVFNVGLISFISSLPLIQESLPLVH